MDPKVRCDIKKCVHNLGGTNCGAQTLEIQYNNSAGSQATICNTYQSYYEGADNVVLNTNASYTTQSTANINSVKVNPIAKCQVTDCKYNANNGYCNAKSISVTLNKTSECTTYNPKK
ncbi:DUF1540 domain-containing protein [Clostridium sp. 'deep sea']|uniref:DUF1540 domain-containing protein n=1 Tax=Clostridium sp. 'deep sea' TaxID=2779445 RepID=UPI00189672A4|nr:DUF1540 domain-containing protein [Clostridium sp. 'deep sea']QOR36951.1 DUF1540 domain-containing protein [Clostridium sp. 'deep sea']